MIIQWDDAKFSCGHSTIDAQHKELFTMVNKLHDATSEGKGRDQLPQMMEFLKNYVVRHFSQEESLMAQCKCTSAEENKKAHADFLKQFTTLYDQYKTQGMSTAIVVQIQGMAARWLTAHIMKVDTHLKTAKA